MQEPVRVCVLISDGSVEVRSAGVPLDVTVIDLEYDAEEEYRGEISAELYDSAVRDFPLDCDITRI